MASGLEEMLETLRAKIEALGSRNEELQRQLMLSKREVEDLQHDKQLLESQVARLQGDNKFLKVSYRLASSPNDIIETRRLISGLIRNIDKCISELKE
jgi:chromosome segregation ATPase